MESFDFGLEVRRVGKLGSGNRNVSALVYRFREDVV